MDLLDMSSFADKIADKSLKVTVVGLGKMGLPIAMVFADNGYHVVGYDISQPLVEQLNKGYTELTSEPNVVERLRKTVDDNRFKATSDIDVAVKYTDVIITIIPILDTEEGEQNLSVLKDLYYEMASHCATDTLFIQESTLAPGTSKNELWPILEKVGNENSVNFGLVFAPERTLSGRAIQDIEDNYPKLIGGINSVDTQVAARIYDTVAKKGVIQLSNATTAEAVKTFKGAYRDANIAIANQFAIMADKYGVDVLEVIDAANTEPYSHIHRPGIGVGGHCIPVYPKFLIHSSTQMGYSPEILINSREANDFMVDYAIESLKIKGKPMERVLILGLAYRNGVKEYRHSPTLRLVPNLRAEKVEVNVTDPLYTSEEIDYLFGEDTGIDFNQVDYTKFDTIIIATDHTQFQDLGPKLSGKQIFDGRYVLDQDQVDGLLLQPGRMVLNS